MVPRAMIRVLRSARIVPLPTVNALPVHLKSNCYKILESYRCPQFRQASGTSFKQVGADQRLRRVLEAEIIHAEEADDSDKKVELPEGFPFEIVDNPGDQMVILRRTFAGETIELAAHMPDLTEEGAGSEEDKTTDENDEDPSHFEVSFDVKIIKGEGPFLELCCTGQQNELIIDEMQIKNPENAEDTIPYNGPRFSDLDETLQKHMLKYLEVRGIDGSLTDFLKGYMVQKDNHEYLRWLKNVKNFLET